MLKERKDFMEREIENNKELERNISTAERQVLRLRQQLQEGEKNQRRLQDEVGLPKLPNTVTHFLKVWIHVSMLYCPHAATQKPIKVYHDERRIICQNTVWRGLSTIIL